jgi:hypothetical protein
MYYVGCLRSHFPYLITTSKPTSTSNAESRATLMMHKQRNICSNPTHLSLPFAPLGNKAQMRHACTLCCRGQKASLISRVHDKCYRAAITASLRSVLCMFAHNTRGKDQISCGHAHGQITMHASTPYDPEQRCLWRQWSSRYSYQIISNSILANTTFVIRKVNNCGRNPAAHSVPARTPLTFDIMLLIS